MSTKGPGLTGQLSRMLMVMFGSAPEFPGAAGPMPLRGVSLTNHYPVTARQPLDLPGRIDRFRPGQSLCNILSQAPFAPSSRLLLPTEELLCDDRAAPPVQEIQRFYRTFLSGLLERHPDVKGVQLRAEVCMAVEEARVNLTCEEASCLPEPLSLSEPGRLSDASELALAQGGAGGPDIEIIRRAYLAVLQRILARLSARVDPTIVKLVFRLAARKALKGDPDIVEKHSLLEGIAEKYLRQVGP
jgi:hypothetical protein